jgi:hypothetical protein
MLSAPGLTCSFPRRKDSNWIDSQGLSAFGRLFHTTSLLLGQIVTKTSILRPLNTLLQSSCNDSAVR